MLWSLPAASRVSSLPVRRCATPATRCCARSQHFIGALNSFRSLGAVPVGVPMDADGINVEAFEEAAVRTGARLAYLIPTFQNPSGITMSAEKRRAVSAIACRRSIIIIEDNPYGRAALCGQRCRYDKEHRQRGCRYLLQLVLEDILAPGIRIGFVQAPIAVISKMVVAKQVEDVHTPMLTQMLAYAFMQSGTMDEHIRSAAELYGRECALMLSRLDRCMRRAGQLYTPRGRTVPLVHIPGERGYHGADRASA